MHVAFSHMHYKLKSWGGLVKIWVKFISRGQGCEEKLIQLGLESLAGNEYIGWEEGT